MDLPHVVVVIMAQITAVDRKRRFVKPLAVLVAVGLVLPSCSDLRRDPRSLAPASSNHPWASDAVPILGHEVLSVSEQDHHLAAHSLDTGRTYSLPDLVDLAQSRNASTRAAWETARATAASIGMAKSQYYPLLAIAASSGGGYSNSKIRIDANLAELAKRNDLLGALLGGNASSNASLNLDTSADYSRSVAGLDLKWLLFDFGGRRATLDAARKATLAANLSFNATHQSLTYKVVEAYVLYEAARSEVQASQVSAESARGILKATQAKADHGLSTDPELLRSKQVAAESDYALTTANSKLRMAYVDLAEAAVIPPGVELNIGRPNIAQMSAGLEKPLDTYIRLALLRRPDLQAKLAVVQAREAELRKARSAGMPTVSLLGSASYTGFDNDIRGSGALKEVDADLQNYGAFLTVQWPLFTGGYEENSVRAAESTRRAAEEELALARDKAVADVWRGYVKAKNSISSRSVADAMLAASRASYDSALAGYDRGVVTNQDLLLARGAYAKALYTRSEADSAVLGALASLALGSGDIEDELIKRFRK
ncbi:MAG: outer rane efflux protein [Akkermansiaceae bacterium]|nr:outer rane efflux protein [Akkermansiaceae bacterium]